eukprot:TRINITY_DN3050_c0_g3_i3.p1 TRINITY_DN3050_c0_g3~~TRINITY_DN3050_c0_g3_i3.p1  ORF type:complete len:167 (-),score=48.77 TRINITY_DN3050_c0_g3_i3:464-964(-)
MADARRKGTVKWFDTQKGFGFITPDGGDENTKDIFVHQSVIQTDGFRSLAQGEVVEFDLEVDAKGSRASNVTGPGGAPPQGAPRPQQRRFDRYGDNQQQQGEGQGYQPRQYNNRGGYQRNYNNAGYQPRQNYQGEGQGYQPRQNYGQGQNQNGNWRQSKLDLIITT